MCIFGEPLFKVYHNYPGSTIYLFPVLYNDTTTYWVLSVCQVINHSSVSISLSACVLIHLSCVQLFATLWTVAFQAPLSMGFSRQEYWSGYPCPPPGDFLSSEIEIMSLMSPALSGSLSILVPAGKPFPVYNFLISYNSASKLILLIHFKDRELVLTKIFEFAQDRFS